MSTDTPAPARQRAPRSNSKQAQASAQKALGDDAHKVAEPEGRLQQMATNARAWTPEVAVATAVRDFSDLAATTDGAAHQAKRSDMDTRSDASPAYKEALDRLSRQGHQMEESADEERAPFTPKVVGDYLVSLDKLPAAVKQAAEKAFGIPGRDLQIAGARFNGDYKGRVIESGDYLIQQVRENSAVVHSKGDITLGTKLSEERMNGADVAIHYSESKATAYPRNAEKERLDVMVGALKKMARKLGIQDVDQFTKSLDKVKDGLWAERTQARQQAREQSQAARGHAGGERRQAEREH